MNITRRVLFTQITPALANGTAELYYGPHNPFAVALTFTHGPEWQFARDLLSEGLRGHAGVGDVRMWPDGTRLMVALSSNYGTAQVSLDRDQVRRFLLATYRAVAPGHERIDLDDLIGQLLDDGAA